MGVEARNRKMLGGIALVAVSMIGVSYAAVPLYQLFCQVTGFGGTTQVAETGDVEVIERTVQIRFAANTNRGLAWEFRPLQTKQNLRIGEQGLAFYEAVNLSDKPVTGMATYNVAPHKAGEYFAKMECFCFTEQTLMPGQRVEMPVVYFVDPLIAEDRNLDDVKEIVLSYTFFEKAGEDNESTAGPAVSTD